MKSVSGKALCKVLAANGWDLKRISSSHHVYGKNGVPVILTVPVHSNQDLKRGTLNQLLKDAGLSEKDL